MALSNIEEIQAALPDVSEEDLLVLIRDVEAIAAIHAPCITSPTFKYKDAARAVIKKAIIYDVKSQEENNSIKREAMGPYSYEYQTPTRSGGYFSKSQIETLQRLCPTAAPGLYSIKAEAQW